MNKIIITMLFGIGLTSCATPQQNAALAGAVVGAAVGASIHNSQNNQNIHRRVPHTNYCTVRHYYDAYGRYVRQTIK